MSQTSAHQIVLRALAKAFTERADACGDRTACEVMLGFGDAFDMACDELVRRDMAASDRLDHNPSGFHLIKRAKNK